MEEQSTTNMYTPRSFLEIPKLWFQLPRFSKSFLLGELHHASGRNTIFGILTYAVLNTVISLLIFLLQNQIHPITNPSLPQFTFTTILILYCFIGLFGLPISFYLNVGVTYLSCLIFGGKGSFTSQAYLTSLYMVPLGLLSSIFTIAALIPNVGIFISSIVAIGSLILHVLLEIRMLKVVHGFSTGRAVSATFAPILLFLVPFISIAVLILMGSVIGNIFSTVNTGIPAPLP